jgi:excinuclease UvrABC ATPase subunit
MGEIMEKINREVYREFFVKEETCQQCQGNGYVMVRLNADPVPLDCKQCNNQGYVYARCESTDNGHIFEARGPHIVTGGTN